MLENNYQIRDQYYPSFERLGLERSGFSQVSYSYSLKTKAYYTIFQSEDNFPQSLAIKSALLFKVKKISTTKFVFKLIIKNKHSRYSFEREKRLKHKAKK